MSKLPVISGDECMSALEKLGYSVRRTRGSHFWMTCPGRAPVPIPRHDALGKGILRKIIRIADISVEDFIELLKE